MEFKNAIVDSKKSVVIKLHVLPCSKKTIFPVRFNKWRECFEIKVKSEAKDGKANSEVLSELSKYFNISINRIDIKSGEKNRDKTILIKDISIDEVRKKLEVSLNEL